MESVSPNFRKTARKIQCRQFSAESESARPDSLQTVGEIQFREAGAAFKAVVSDRLNAGSERNTFEIPVPIKSLLTDRGDAFLNDQRRNRHLILVPFSTALVVVVFHCAAARDNKIAAFIKRPFYINAAGAGGHRLIVRIVDRHPCKRFVITADTNLCPLQRRTGKADVCQ